MNGKRSTRALLAQETVAVLHSGGYTSTSGKQVDIREALAFAMRNTRTYPPTERVSHTLNSDHVPQIAVTNETTFAAAQRLWRNGQRVVVLNFASARRPGGGFLNGARAQEEDLARGSGLYSCIVNNEMYRYHNAQSDAMYSSYAIYSPDVPVFRDDNDQLIDEPWPCSIITCAAVNAGALRDKSNAAIEAAMEDRVRKILAIAVVNGHEAIVLGAWGCGVFRNDGEVIARLFRDALTTRFRGAFRAVTFAVLDWSDDRHFIGPFERAFAG